MRPLAAHCAASWEQWGQLRASPLGLSAGNMQPFEDPWWHICPLASAWFADAAGRMPPFEDPLFDLMACLALPSYF